MAKKKASLSFEQSLVELEEIVKGMEKGDLSLEESLKAFERGVQLTRDCQTALKEAEQKVSLLVEKNGDFSLQAFEGDQTHES